MNRNKDYEYVEIEGDWEWITRGGYGPSYLRDSSNGQQANSVRFAPKMLHEGDYQVYVYFSRTADATSQTTVISSDGTEEKEQVIKESDIRVEGQTSGEWVAIGKQRLSPGSDAYVTISNAGADGAVVADAVLWVPVR
ncbi:MAG: hypothetical protein JJU34_07490 [Lunatimonas sp.]|uniref:golvesin C-terminal-like domain-containing protein n=1 Tax=Lunatimonas sp. TaxID=2060141 RepID=UPI00263B731F|nr:hypothetical protein [Lunatimonas sp.]MCC5937108.1 hypothetical protein [Lunatimonas sp.]